MSPTARVVAGKIAALAGACLVLSSAAAATLDGRFDGWITERGVTPPSYAVTQPIANGLNVDTVVLLCTEIGRRRSLELDLYLSTDGPLIPNHADPRHLKDEPRARIEIDGQTFPVDLLFADGYVVVADSREGDWPALSPVLLDALEHGRSLRLRFDLLAEPTGQPAAFDSHLVVDLESGHSAIHAVRQCASAGPWHQADLRKTP